MKKTDRKALPFGKVSLPTLKLLDGYKITLAGLKVLIYLDARENVTNWGYNIYDVANNTGLTSRCVTKWLQFFERQGVLIKVPADEYAKAWDKRMTYFRLDHARYCEVYRNQGLDPEAKPGEGEVAKPGEEEEAQGDAVVHTKEPNSEKIDDATVHTELTPPFILTLPGCSYLDDATVHTYKKSENKKEEDSKKRYTANLCSLEARTEFDGGFFSSLLLPEVTDHEIPRHPNTPVIPNEHHLLNDAGLSAKEFAPYRVNLTVHNRLILTRLKARGMLPDYVNCPDTLEGIARRGTIIMTIIDQLIREGQIEPFKKLNDTATPSRPPEIAPSLVKEFAQKYGIPELPPESGKVAVPAEGSKREQSVPPSAKTTQIWEQIHAFLQGKCDPSVPDEPPQNDAKGGQTPPVPANPTGNPPPTPQDGTALPPQ